MDWIDAIGKLGTLSVAIAVFIVNRNQFSWANKVAKRAAEVENEKFRLSLLERRLQAIDELRRSHGAVRDNYDPVADKKLQDALRMAEVVFEEDQLEHIRGTIKALMSLREAHHMIPRCIIDEQKMWTDMAFTSDITLLRRVEGLLESLLAATKVRVIAPI